MMDAVMFDIDDTLIASVSGRRIEKVYSLYKQMKARGYKIEDGGSIGRINGAYCPRGLPANQEFCDIRTDWRGNGLAATAR